MLESWTQKFSFHQEIPTLHTSDIQETWGVLQVSMEYPNAPGEKDMAVFWEEGGMEAGRGLQIPRDPLTMCGGSIPSMSSHFPS